MKSAHSSLMARAGVAALIAGLSACSPAVEDDRAASPEPSAGTVEAAPTPDTTHDTPAPVAGEGDGEGEGGDGGEFGIDPAVAATDPVVYLTALEVMRAHYLAGMAAYDEGREAIGGTMFSHPISEIYIDLEDVLIDLGAPEFYELLLETSRAPFQDASAEEVHSLVDQVLMAIDTASQHTPESALSEPAIQARVIANMAERAALQYAFAAESEMKSGPYLDGFGFYRSAEEILSRHESAIAAVDADSAVSLRAVVDALAAAYPVATAPEQLGADSDALVALAQEAQDQVAALN